LLAAELDTARLGAVLAAVSGGPAGFAAPEGATPQQIEVQRALMLSQIEEFRAKLAGLDRQVAQNEANRAAVAATVQKLTLAIPLLQQRVEARKYLMEKEVGSRLTYLEIEQDLVEHEQELQVQQARLEEAKAALAALLEQRRESESEFTRTNLGDLVAAQQKASSLKEELIKAREHAALQTLTAPVDGTVQQLAVHTVGGVVTPAQQLMVIVPADSHLEIEAMVPNRDVGFVHAGEAAAIKIDTFNFTRYGLLHGKVLTVSRDAIARDRPQEKTEETPGAGAVGDSSEPKGQELVYAARVSLEQTQMQIDGKPVALSPGMAVTVEIKTGSRRVIDYLLSPLLRYQQDSLRER
jgi:hemolysin D